MDLNNRVNRLLNLLYEQESIKTDRLDKYKDYMSDDGKYFRELIKNCRYINDIQRKHLIAILINGGLTKAIDETLFIRKIFNCGTKLKELKLKRSEESTRIKLKFLFNIVSNICEKNEWKCFHTFKQYMWGDLSNGYIDYKIQTNLIEHNELIFTLMILGESDEVKLIVNNNIGGVFNLVNTESKINDLLNQFIDSDTTTNNIEKQLSTVDDSKKILSALNHFLNIGTTKNIYHVDLSKDNSKKIMKSHINKYFPAYKGEIQIIGGYGDINDNMVETADINFYYKIDGDSLSIKNLLMTLRIRDRSSNMIGGTIPFVMNKFLKTQP